MPQKNFQCYVASRSNDLSEANESMCERTISVISNKMGLHDVTLAGPAWPPAAEAATKSRDRSGARALVALQTGRGYLVDHTGTCLVGTRMAWDE